MNKLQSTLGDCWRDERSIEKYNLCGMSRIGIFEASFATLLGIVSCVSIWKLVHLVVLFINRIN